MNDELRIFVDKQDTYFDMLRKKGYGAAHERKVRRFLTDYASYLTTENPSQKIHSQRTIQSYIGWKHQQRQKKPYPQIYRNNIKHHLKHFLSQYVYSSNSKHMKSSKLKERIGKFISETKWSSPEQSADIEKRIQNFFYYLERRNFSNYGKISLKTIEGYIAEAELKIDESKKCYSAALVLTMKTEIRKYFQYLGSNDLIEYADHLKPRVATHFMTETIGSYINFCKDARGLAPRTLVAMETYLNQLAEYLEKLGGRNFSFMQIHHIESFCALRRLSPHSLGSLYSMMRRYLKYLYLEKLIARDMAELLVGPRTFSMAHIPRFLTPEELKRLFEERPDSASAVEVRAQAIVYLVLYTGLRAGEAAGVQLDDLDWDKRQILIRNRKNGRDLLQILPDPAIRAIYRYVVNVRPCDRPERSLFFTLHAPIVPMKASAIGSAIQSHFESRDIPGQVHRLRHSHAQLLLESGSSLQDVQGSLGHESEESTKIYAKTSMARMAKYVVMDND